MYKVFFETFGCQMNVADSDMLADMLAERGYASCAVFEEADLIVVNTCSVRAHAESRAKARITEYCNRKKRLQELWVTGCMAQRLGDALKKEIPKIGRVIGARSLEHLADDIDSYLVKKSRPTAGNMRPAPVSVFLPVMRGCDNYCAYCVVPFVRGKERSIPQETILEQARHLAGKGAREIILLGQNVNSYADGATDFAGIISRIHTIDGVERIRFTTSHPKDLSEKLIKTIADLPKVCKHLHLPVQSGSSKILQAMNRGYTRDQYLKKIDAVRHAVPSIDLTTDVMVGFPGETDRDYADTVSLFNQAAFTAAFMFAYSNRPGTQAASMPDQVPEHVKKERLNSMIALQTGITKELYASMVHKEVQVLFTHTQGNKENTWIGQDYGCKRVLLHTDKECAGKLLTLLVARSTGMTLIAKG